MVVVPAARLDPAFFDLRSGVAGEVLQRFVNYRIRLAILGDVTEHIERNNALAALVREANRGGDLCFAPDEAALADWLAASR